MLFFLGKDVFRWLEQCAEWAESIAPLRGQSVRPQSFAALLTSQPPEMVREKLVRWGVSDSASIFSRAIGLNVLFAQPPALEWLSDEFLRNYHRYADTLYRTWLGAEPHRTATQAEFRFELYASGEYSRILESKWAGE
jgi:hypothetical protein